MTTSWAHVAVQPAMSFAALSSKCRTGSGPDTGRSQVVPQLEGRTSGDGFASLARALPCLRQRDIYGCMLAFTAAQARTVAMVNPPPELVPSVLDTSRPSRAFVDCATDRSAGCLKDRARRPRWVCTRPRDALGTWVTSSPDVPPHGMRHIKPELRRSHTGESKVPET